MKTYRSIFAVLIIFFICVCINSQDNPSNTFCATPDSLIVFQGPIGTATMDVVFVFLDFPDGRLSNGQIPSTESELNQVRNLDAVLNMGFLQSEGGVGYDLKVRKYTYDDFWNMYFSTNTFTGTAHPDWDSHGAYGFPPDGDTARAFGSFLEYFSEVSYGKLTINAPITHTNESGMYRTGIVNNIIHLNGVKYIRPIKFQNEKSYYFRENNEARAFDEMLTEAPSRVAELHNLPSNHPDYIEFDITSYSGNVIFVFAGGTNGFGGLAKNKNAIVREKRSKNIGGDDRGKIINGLTVYCHEMSHLLGVMTTGTSNQNCPSHLSIDYKLKAGWIDPQYVRFFNSNQNVADLPPSIHNGDCAIVTIYGKAGYSESTLPIYEHSEYYIIENRRMLRDNPDYKFDKKFVWHPERMPEGFNGGCLVTHFSSYNSLSGQGFKIINADVNEPVSPSDEGHSNHFFGVIRLGGLGTPFTTLTDNDAGIDRTKSSFDLRTGIRLTNIIDPSDGNIDFSLNYSLGTPPDYDKILYGQQLPDPFVMDGVYFVSALGSLSVSSISGNVEITEGTTIESINQGLWYTSTSSNSNFEANGTSENPITFQGAGYQNFRLNFYGMSFTNINNVNTMPLRLEY